jgi:hypothetical protein
MHEKQRVADKIIEATTAANVVAADKGILATLSGAGHLNVRVTDESVKDKAGTAVVAASEGVLAALVNA